MLFKNLITGERLMKKYLMLTIVLIVGLLLLSGCKTADDEFDILGAWSASLTLNGAVTNNTLTFRGSNVGGTVTTGLGWEGGFTVSNKSSITFSYDTSTNEYGRVHVSYTGNVISDSSMSGNGTAVYLDLGNQSVTFTWTASKM